MGHKTTTLFSLLGDLLFGSEEKKYASRHRLLEYLARRNGFALYNKSLSWHEDREFLEIWKGFPEAGDAINDRRYVLYSVVKSLAGLPGDTAECGVYRGAGSYLICVAKQHGCEEKHHLFDSFEGLSNIREEDIVSEPGHCQWGANDLATPQHVVRRNLRAFDQVLRLYDGWIPDRFGEVEERKFAFIHIDVDLYEPTMLALEFFFPKVVAGGVVLCDDYGFKTCPGARTAIDEFTATVEESVIHLTTGQGMIVKRT